MPSRSLAAVTRDAAPIGQNRSYVKPGLGTERGTAIAEVPNAM
jgi:hypothetical protein